MIGDVVIENIAGAIKTVIRAEDLAGRVGGDEFVVILKNISERWASSKAESINEAISCIYIGENQNYKISASIGISFFGPDGHDYDTLFKKADTAMYYSKKGGKNKVTLFNSGSHEVIGGSYDEQDDVDSIIQKEYDKGFLQYTYTLFLNSKSFDSTLNILLERVGKKYNLSTVSIMENTTNDKIYYETNKWERGQGIVTRGLHIDEKVYLKALESFKPNEINIIEDCLDPEKICESDREFFIKHEFRGYASTLIENQELHNGIVFFFIDRNNPLKLSEYDKETLYQFCLTVTLFITMHSNTLRNAHELEKLYTFDRLTGVNNLETFMIKGNEIIKNMDRFRYYALMYSDIVGFSHVNESLGFDYGDEILINYATIISGEPNVETVCRVHSDLFANIISADSRVEVLATIERIRAKFYAYQEHYFPTAGCKINIGVYHIEDGSQDMSYAFDCANLARKNARLSNSANITFYAEEMRLDRNMEQSITSGIHSAIANGDLMIYLQPKIDMRTDKIVGAESLIRWTDKNGGVTLPDTFVPALEKQGSIVDVDFFAFEETLKTINKWKQEGKKDIRISVNFSRRHNSIPNFVDRIVSLTEKHHVEPHEVEIEVTESCLASDSDVMYRNLEKLHDMGFVISMDDFGTGYYSLEILLSSPVDIVKIDKSFLRKFDEGELNKEYIIKICELIRVTGKDIVFEGIENQNQIDFLLGNNCYYGQGFFFSKAIPVREFEEKFLFK
jgi:diguanylate cyclase (GGDEF)-like protein